MGGEIKGFKQATKEQLSVFTKQYHALQKKEEFLRRLQSKQGKGTSYQDAWEDFLD